MDSRKAIFVDDTWEYNLIQDGNKFLLYYCDNGHWSHPNTLTLGIECDGNGYKLIKPLEKKNVIDYSEAIELLILLSAVKESKIEIFEKTGEI
jgi:hypothetical protein